jgi:phosphatidylglycerophosphatase A
LTSLNRGPFPWLIKALASGGFLGYSPFASGTVGTLWGIPIFLFLAGKNIWLQGAIITVSIFGAVFLSARASRIWGEKDPSKVVADEIVGYMTAMVALPFSWTLAWTGFFLFRVMDVLKPFPIRNIDRQWPGGWGIVLDDVLAGVYTHIMLQILMAYTVL